ncbi:MAG: alpha/beta fold hydrolase, partial [Desulfobacterales bacterium]|nr:alpha/beta fold hydrolase [Desulfobacterales bacterium]
VIEMLSENVHVIAIDAPGHGKSLFYNITKKIVFFSDVGELIIDTLQKIGIEKFYLYGYSMGGRIAQNICINYSSRIKSLILESSSFGIFDEIERQKRYEMDLSLLKDVYSHSDFYNFLRKWHGLPMFASLNYSDIMYLISAKMENNLDELKQAIKILSCGNHPFFADLLKDINVPILYLYGEDDEKYTEIGIATNKIIPSIKIMQFNNASHNIHIQFPEKIVALINHEIHEIHEKR